MKKGIKISSRKAKARKLQDWIAEKISEITGLPYGHSDEMLIEGRLMGQKGVDVVLRKEALEKFPFSVEAKAVERFNLYDAIEQVKNNMYPNTNWLVFHKKNRSDPVVILDASSFFNLIKKIGENNV